MNAVSPLFHSETVSPLAGSQNGQKMSRPSSELLALEEDMLDRLIFMCAPVSLFDIFTVACCSLLFLLPSLTARVLASH